MTVVGSLTLRSTELDIDVTKWGVFMLKDDTDNTIGSGDTLEKAKAQAGAELAKRKVKVSVPFALDDGRRGIADGIHARNRTVLCTLDSRREEISGRGSSGTLNPHITDAELARLKEIDAAVGVLKRERHGITEKYRFDLVTEVNRAIDEKVEAESA